MNDMRRPSVGDVTPARASRGSPRWIMACALALATFQSEALANDKGAGEGPEELASHVKTIFAARCSECHGGSRDKGGFGNLTDLKRVASNPGIVVRFHPDQSRLWQLVQSGEMPLEGNRAGPLSDAEKGVVRRGIAAGAPAPSSSSQVPEIVPEDKEQPSEPLPLPFVRRLLRWVGKFHVLVVHFPIALLAAAALAELGCAWLGRRELWSVVRFCVLLGAAGAAVAATFGWLHADIGGYGAGSAQVLAIHRWLGTVAALWALGLAWLSEAQRRRRSRLFRGLLWLGTGLMGAAAHFGGTLVHGGEFFRW
jgi:mono/diheme cytochrome c family protein/uncharacterized membrane protein